MEYSWSFQRLNHQQLDAKHYRITEHEHAFETERRKQQFQQFINA